MTRRQIRGCARTLSAFTASVLATVAAAAEPAAPASGEWNFQVSLDGTPIGRHRFSLEPDGHLAKLTSDASFDVKILGFTAYRYRHRATETWRGGCLASLASTTDDDGQPSSVRVAAADEREVITTATGTQSIDGCLMTFAYWNPAMRTQLRLLNAQTGKVEPVQVQRIADARISVHGEEVAATGYRVVGAARPIDLWYAADGSWIGLDSLVAAQRKLSYRLP